MASLFALPTLLLKIVSAIVARPLQLNLHVFPERYTDLYNEYQALFEQQIESE